MWQLAEVSTAAVKQLTAAAIGFSTCSTIFKALSETAASLGSLPSCLLPLFSKAVSAGAPGNVSLPGYHSRPSQLEQLLLSVLGDLEEVWADKQLQQALLELPLAAVALLLDTDKLKVASEDTVLFTAHAYIKHMASNRSPYAKQEAAAAAERLASLVRCPYLSQYWLAAAAAAPAAAAGSAVDPAAVVFETPDQMLRSVRSHGGCLQRLHLLRSAASDHKLDRADLAASGIPCPPSWMKGPRYGQHKGISSVSTTWRLEVSALKQLVQAASRSSTPRVLESDPSPPFRGLSWRLQLQCSSSACGSGLSRLVLRVLATNAPKRTFYRGSFAVSFAQRHLLAKDQLVRFDDEQARGAQTSTSTSTAEVVFDDPFLMGTIYSGWDEAAWAKVKALPASESVELMLKIF